jgi:hypothetical protein
MWVLLKKRCYNPWMLWVATALARAGEGQMACEAAAQGLLPSACDFWVMSKVTRHDRACLAALLPLLEARGKYAGHGRYYQPSRHTMDGTNLVFTNEAACVLEEKSSHVLCRHCKHASVCHLWAIISPYVRGHSATRIDVSPSLLNAGDSP